LILDRTRLEISQTLALLLLLSLSLFALRFCRAPCTRITHAWRCLQLEVPTLSSILSPAHPVTSTAQLTAATHHLGLNFQSWRHSVYRSVNRYSKATIMVGLKSFLSAKSFRRTHNSDNAERDSKNSTSDETAGGVSSNSIATDADYKPKESTSLIAGFQKVFGNHRRRDNGTSGLVPMVSAIPSALATSPLTPQKLYRFRSPKNEKVSTVDKSIEEIY
jgi:hypothetical protein